MMLQLLIPFGLLLTSFDQPPEREPPVIMMNCHKARDQERIDKQRAHIARFENIVPHKDASQEALQAIERIIADGYKELERLEQWVELCRGMPDVPL